MVQIIFPGCICYIYLDSTYYSHLKIFKKKRSSKRHLTPSFAWKLCTSMLTIVVCRTCVKVFSRQFSILSWIPSFSIMFRLWHHEKRGGFCIKIWSGHHFFIVKNRESGFSLFRQSGTASVHRGKWMLDLLVATFGSSVVDGVWLPHPPPPKRFKYYLCTKTIPIRVFMYIHTQWTKTIPIILFSYWCNSYYTNIKNTPT